MSIRVVASQKIQDAKRDEFLALCREMVEATRKEDGCIAYDLCESADEPGAVAFIEAWESKDTLDAHMQSEHFKRIIPQIGKLSAPGTSAITVYEQII
jgi:quinol monooxygenase YgiN